MSFMEHQIEFGEWFIYESKDGGIYAIEHDLMDCISEDEVSEVVNQRIEGWGARLSARGYLDCTEWIVFDTKKDACDYLDTYYPEDEEDTE